MSQVFGDLYSATAVTYAANGEIYLSGEFNYKLRQNLNSVIPAVRANTFTISEFATVFDNFFAGPGGDYNRFDLSRNGQEISFSSLTNDGIGLNDTQIFFPNSATIIITEGRIFGSDDNNIYSAKNSFLVVHDKATLTPRQTSLEVLSPTIVGNSVLSVFSDSFRLHDLSTLQQKWRLQNTGFSRSYLASTTDGVIYLRSSNSILAVDENTGVTLWSVTPSSNISSSNGVIDSDGTLFIGLANGILKLSPNAP